ncbi:TAT [Symbiodinium microadriaticum]|nr:TAT [Symbiodinium microadriaticum]
MKIEASLKAKRTHNPIRAIVDNLRPPREHSRPLLNLALGDPTAYGNLKCPEVMMDAVKESLDSQAANGYLPSTGFGAARKAIAKVSSFDDYTVEEDDIVICSGCSRALELAITVLVNEGDNILVPRPGFPLYQVITESLGGHVKQYMLKAENDWECDLEDMDRQVDENTKAILITNPSNPCGSNYTAQHLAGVVEVARRHNLPIIADEIYGGLVFDGHFTSVSSLNGDVPVLAVGGLAKEFIVPGWRVGWVTVYDRTATKVMAEVKSGLKSLSQLILGGCTVQIQSPTWLHSGD